MFDFLKNPMGFIRCFGSIPSLPKNCIVCGEKASQKYKLNRLYDPGIGAWLLGLTFSYRKIPIFFFAPWIYFSIYLP